MQIIFACLFYYLLRIEKAPQSTISQSPQTIMNLVLDEEGIFFLPFCTIFVQ